MEDMDIKMDIKPTDWIPENSMIKVIGVGGGGCNAVTYMYNQRIQGCTFIVCNTDAQALRKSNVPIKVQLGEGLGAGTDPTKGRNCALASQEEIESKVLDCGTKMLFITAGMGGGTGTGAAPVIARMAKDKGILTVGVVTLPFKSEKNGSYSKALDGVRDLADNVDSLLIIDNEKLAEIYKDLLLKEAFPKSDEVLATAVRGITEIISRPGYINIDFEDVKNMMRGSGMALMGCGNGSGENRLVEAVNGALDSPLLYKLDLSTAKHALVNITTGDGEEGLRMGDLTTINDLIAAKIGNANKFKQGIVYDEDPGRGDKVSITVIATGFKMDIIDDIVSQPGSNILLINSDFKYNPDTDVDVDPEVVQKIVKVNIGNPTRTFHYDTKPALCITPRDEFSPLENIASITRKR